MSWQMKLLFYHLSNENSFVLDREVPDIVKWDIEEKNVHISVDIYIVVVI